MAVRTKTMRSMTVCMVAPHWVDLPSVAVVRTRTIQTFSQMPRDRLSRPLCVVEELQVRISTQAAICRNPEGFHLAQNGPAERITLGATVGLLVGLLGGLFVAMFLDRFAPPAYVPGKF